MGQLPESMRNIACPFEFNQKRRLLVGTTVQEKTVAFQIGIFEQATVQDHRDGFLGRFGNSKLDPFPHFGKAKLSIA
jgi:hypothetical protein